MIGSRAVFEGDHRNKVGFREVGDKDPLAQFLEPETAPGAALARACLRSCPNTELEAFPGSDNPYAFFQKMVDMDLAATRGHAKNICHTAFETSPEYATQFEALETFLMETAKHPSEG